MRRVVHLSDAFAIVLKQHRTAKGLTHEALAEKADLHPTYISMLERSVRTPKLEVAQSLAKALGVPLSRLIRDAELILKTGQP